MGILAVAILLGFLGSFHCIGMCGPIALALPVHNKGPVLKYFLIVFYNLGRITTYTSFGLLAGVIGKGFTVMGLQQGLSVTVGLILLASAFLSFKNSFPGYSFFLWIKNTIGRLFLKGIPSSLFVIGLLNGFLPCGLVYTGIAGAVATGDVLKGALFMTVFGLGTVPMMFAIPLISSVIPVSARNRIRKANPFIIALMGFLLVTRGLNLGIPYLSPGLNKSTATAFCHEGNAGDRPVIKCYKPVVVEPTPRSK